MTSDTLLEAGSFRDKTNRVFYRNDGIFRSLNAQALDEWTALSTTAFYAQLVETHKVVTTHLANVPPPATSASASPWVAVLEHERIPFISYPYEWPFGMLKDAAALQLELLRRALAEGMTLKDATPFNIQWIGSRPVFIDITSFTSWIPGNPWIGYRQFCELFLYPLFLQVYRDIPFQAWLRGSLDGIPVDVCRKFWSWRDVFRPGILKDVILHAQLQNQFSQSQRALKTDLQKAGFTKELILANVKRLEKVVQSLSWKPSGAGWSHYATERSYSADDYEKKKKFVAEFVRSKPRQWVWDLGCNTGDFSRIAAETAECVVAMDADPGVVENFYQALKKENNAKILPLVMNLAEPSSGLGWRGQERKALADRGRPDLTLCLALLHHIVISAHIPMDEWIQWLAGWKSDLVIEFVSRDDPMTAGLLRNKDGRHDDYGQGNFEKILGEAFHIRKTLTLCGGKRVLYACENKALPFSQ